MLIWWSSSQQMARYITGFKWLQLINLRPTCTVSLHTDNIIYAAWSCSMYVSDIYRYKHKENSCIHPSVFRLRWWISCFSLTWNSCSMCCDYCSGWHGTVARKEKLWIENGKTTVGQRCDIPYLSMYGVHCKWRTLASHTIRGSKKTSTGHIDN